MHFFELDKSRPHDEDGCEAEQVVHVPVKFREYPSYGAYGVDIPGLALSLSYSAPGAHASVQKFLQRHMDMMPNSMVARVLFENRKRAQTVVEVPYNEVLIKVPRFIEQAVMAAT